MNPGHIIVSHPTGALAEVVACSMLLDIALVEWLNMEGGRTGRFAYFAPSRIIKDQ